MRFMGKSCISHAFFRIMGSIVREYAIVNKNKYYCPLSTYILHKIKRFMLYKPCFHQELENSRISFF